MVRLQTGYLYHYAFAMLIGIAALVTLDDAPEFLLMTDWPILSTVTFLPLVGVVLLLLMNGERNRPEERAVDLADHHTSSPSSSRSSSGSASTMPIRASRCSRSITGSAPALATTSASTASRCCSSSCRPSSCPSVLASWLSIEKRLKEYMIAFLILETMMIGVFVSLDIVLFTSSSRRASFRCS
ncbi:hypothetical protein ACOJBO_38040 [Rhizobium beringeri]